MQEIQNKKLSLKFLQVVEQLTHLQLKYAPQEIPCMSVLIWQVKSRECRTSVLDTLVTELT